MKLAKGQVNYLKGEHLSHVTEITFKICISSLACFLIKLRNKLPKGDQNEVQVTSK